MFKGIQKCSKVFESVKTCLKVFKSRKCAHGRICCTAGYLLKKKDIFGPLGVPKGKEAPRVAKLKTSNLYIGTPTDPGT